jgi:hypothetical protein
LVRVKREQKQEEHRLEEEARCEAERIEDEDRVRTEFLAKQALQTAVNILEVAGTSQDIDDDEKSRQQSLKVKNDSISSTGSSKHSRSSSMSVQDLSPAMLTEMYNGPKKKLANIIMIDGKMMNENQAKGYLDDQKDVFEVERNFEFLMEEQAGDDVGIEVSQNVHQVEINFTAATPKNEDVERFFGEKVEAEK